MKKLTYHPAANTFPLVEGAEREALKYDIEAYGLHDPIIVFEGQILDGRNRYELCLELGIEPDVLNVTPHDIGHDPVSYVVSRNLHRRHLSPSQVAMVLSKLPKNKRGGEKGGQSANLHFDRESIAEQNGVSVRTVKTADKVRAKGTPKVVEAVESGEIAVSDAAALVELPKDRQDKAVESVRRGEVKTARAAVEQSPKALEPLPEDAVGNVLPAKLIPFFELAAEFEEQAKIISKIQSWAKGVEKNPAAAFLHVQSLHADLGNAKRSLRFSAPHAVCPYCKAKKQTCEACHGEGFVNKTVYNAAPTELRA